MTVVISKVGVGTAMRAHNYLLIPEETKSPAVLRRAWLHASQPAKPRRKAALPPERQRRLGQNLFATELIAAYARSTWAGWLFDRKKALEACWTGF
jgi:membrane glycosyltransferase